MRPPLKWAGGKRQLLREIGPLLPIMGLEETYYEPFFGGGAVYFHMVDAPGTFKAVLSDTNQPLMNFYQKLFGGNFDVESEVWKMEDTAVSYYALREEFNARRAAGCCSTARDAAIFWALNRMGFNGLYRVSKDGKYNTPYAAQEPGAKSRTVLLDQAGFFTALVSNIPEFREVDYSIALSTAKAGDFVYLDPPYLPVKDGSFTAYGAPFGELEHIRLATETHRLNSLGVRFLLSNSDVPMAHGLWSGFKIREVQARRSINSDGAGRGRVGELLICNY